MSANAKPNEIHLTRVYDAPVETVWDAWTDPEQVAQWWGPRGFSITTHAKELRPGGFWHYTMHGPDGADYPNWTIYHEVEEHKKLVYDHGGYEDRPPLFHVTVLFIAEGDRTRMEMTMALPTAEQAEATRKFIKEAGGNATWDRLGEYLDKLCLGKDSFVINRSFAASQETVFRLWTDPAHVSQWLPPTGFAMEFLRCDVRPGGDTFYRMTNGAEVTFYGRSSYEEITPPSRLVTTQEFCDEHENISHHPLAPVWPAKMLSVVEFTAEGPNQTRVTVTWQPVGEVTPAERQAFVEARGGMTQGWTGSFDKLESRLEKQI